MSLLPRKEKNLPSWKIWGYTDVLLDEFFFPAPCRQFVIRVKRVKLTFAANLQWLTTCGSLIHENTSSYSRKANTAEHHPIILAGLQTSLECP